MRHVATQAHVTHVDQNICCEPIECHSGELQTQIHLKLAVAVTYLRVKQISQDHSTSLG
jgi:hypothetical protein